MTRQADARVVDAAYREYLAGASYDELVEQYRLAEKTLLRHFRRRGLRGQRGVAKRPRRCPMGEMRDSDPYALYVKGLLKGL